MEKYGRKTTAAIYVKFSAVQSISAFENKNLIYGDNKNL